ncbi:MAG: hypothetical protein HC800_20785 [Phormidesmis sp. RL_2_1]|nr:hypothetical protein [Phormidesmis sp. RL_2_1]
MRNLDSIIYVGSSVGAIFLLSIVFVGLFMSKNRIKMYILSGILAAILVVSGFVLFIVAGDPGDSLYTWLHGTWHILIFLGAYFVIDLKYGRTDQDVEDITKVKSPEPWRIPTNLFKQYDSNQKVNKKIPKQHQEVHQDRMIDRGSFFNCKNQKNQKQTMIIAFATQ